MWCGDVRKWPSAVLPLSPSISTTNSFLRSTPATTATAGSLEFLSLDMMCRPVSYRARYLTIHTPDPTVNCSANRRPADFTSSPETLVLASHPHFQAPSYTNPNPTHLVKTNKQSAALYVQPRRATTPSCSRVRRIKLGWQRVLDRERSSLSTDYGALYRTSMDTTRTQGEAS